MDIFYASVPPWFLIFMFVLLGGYFLISMRQLFTGLQATLIELKTLIKELFEDRNTHEKRITALEARCDERHQNYKRATD